MAEPTPAFAAGTALMTASVPGAITLPIPSGSTKKNTPYQRRLLDTWTLLAYLAARTQRIGLVPDVLKSVVAKSAASLDLLSDGRLDHRVRGDKPGPQPGHPIGLWIGAYGPRMLGLTGRTADGGCRASGAWMRTRSDGCTRAWTRRPSTPGAIPRAGFIRRLGEDVAPALRERAR